MAQWGGAEGAEVVPSTFVGLLWNMNPSKYRL